MIDVFLQCVFVQCRLLQFTNGAINLFKVLMAHYDKTNYLD